ncbi:hypothetical protein G7Y89_g13559 [Cudoniella acicularis]|uniref:Uncharacterized protein n=1 Tax=Cudoniella acicularis TaxID=354080 RepID=A0A8H4VVY4_9HELO|nr:hypothetical protein G7Y89_g13559 [Cudoniella acicularis]
MAVPLIPGASIHRKVSSLTTTSTNDLQSNNSRASDETAHEGIPSILFLGHHGGARQSVIGSILNVKGGFSPQVFVKGLDLRRKPNGVEIHHIEIAFGAVMKDVVVGNTTDNVDDGHAKNQMVREVNLVNTPDMGSEEMRKVQGVLEQRITNGVVSSVCFVHDSDHPHDSFQDKEWAGWRQIIEESSWTQDIFVVILQDGGGPNWNRLLDRHTSVDSVRTFTFQQGSLEVDSKEGKGNPLATSQLLKHLIMDTIPLPVPEKGTAHRTFSQSHNLLLKACRMLCNYLEIRVGGASTSIMSLKANIESLQPFLDESLSAWGKTKSRLSEIDTEDPEVNEVLHGLTSMSHQFNIWNVGGTPNFNFEITCRFPIRAAVNSQSPKSTWVPKHGPEVEPCRFVAEVKNRRMSSAFAKVELFTWRRDIHHEEVAKLRKEEIEQEQSCMQLRSSIDSSKLLRIEAETLFADCTNQLITAKKDLNLLVHCEQQNWDFQDMQTQLMNDSIYDIAKSYGLNSPVRKSHFPSIFNSRQTGILNMFENYNTLLGCCEEYLGAAIDRAKEQELQNCSDPDVNWLGKIVEARVDKDPSLQLRAEMERLTDFIDIYDKEVAETGLHSLIELHQELNEFYQALGEMIGEHQEREASYVRERQLDLQSARVVMNQLSIETSKDAEATTMVLTMMDAKEVDLGVLASLIEQTNKIDVYWTIWKGLRSRISRDKYDG